MLNKPFYKYLTLRKLTNIIPIPPIVKLAIGGKQLIKQGIAKTTNAIKPLTQPFENLYFNFIFF